MTSDTGPHVERGMVNEAMELDENNSPPPYINNPCKANLDRKLKDSEFEDLPHHPSALLEKLEGLWANYLLLVGERKPILKTLAYIVIGILYNIYFIGAVVYFIQNNTDGDLAWCSGLGLLILLTVITYSGLFYGYLFKGLFLPSKLGQSFITSVCKPIKEMCKKVTNMKYFSIIAYLVVLAAFIIFVVIDSADDRRKLISAFGLLTFIFLGAIFSKHPGRIQWRQVVWGVGLQFIFGILILRWSIGREIFECLGHKVESFLAYSDAGSGFVFGYLANNDKPPFNPKLLENKTSITFEVISAINDAKIFNTTFIFKSLSVIYFFSFIISMLFYLGAMQWIISKVGWVLQVTLGSTACESMIAAGNVFLGLAEAPLLIRPYIKKLTPSELHAVMTSGFSTIAGSILAALIAVNVSATHLLSASLMSAPASLACSKLLYPETKKTKTSAKDLEPIKATESNLLDAASQGAGSAVALVTNIAANLIAIISFIAFVNGVLQWFGSLVGAHYLTVEFVLGKIFIPFSWLMGVENDDLEVVGQLLGIKTFVNTLVAYLKFPLVEHQMSPRSKMIATYALCGFSNPASIGITIASLSAMAPERRPDIAGIALRAFVAGGMASCLTACVAGTLVSTG